MPQALIIISENDNRVLNVVKAKYNLKDKSETIAFLISEYIADSDDYALRPEFVAKIRKIEREGHFTIYNSIAEMEKNVTRPRDRTRSRKRNGSSQKKA